MHLDKHLRTAAAFSLVDNFRGRLHLSCVRYRCRDDYFKPKRECKPPTSPLGTEMAGESKHRFWNGIFRGDNELQCIQKRSKTRVLDMRCCLLMIRDSAVGVHHSVQRDSEAERFDPDVFINQRLGRCRSPEKNELCNPTVEKGASD